ncbi:MAG: bifunctional 5,6,7,8-tetrahydromethanopterin hydro-lyase/3-hexulose-6-phosphate synthase [Nitrososphaerota archaeon]|nr:bifunctional 5,6,7,8-tetrahydromethanopterin hydro-lyase/3-hexulose-6-phosphate synthase [Candidatus Bathyarchaeota archaeon]MDW8022755.1 bifunctional 5,6,7,8-tetrahydromethanopterin hydro-lyase/3-hexulose-6-phosphate synthase [Nitrososphaerota archaeon]
MSEKNVKRPESKEEFIRMLTDAARSEAETRGILSGRRAKPTISGTAKMLGVHRDTLYSWLKEFNVDFKEIVESVSATELSETAKLFKGYTYLIGEAFVGEGNEVAHIDLLIGDKDGPVGEAFANGLAHLSMGHTPLLAVIRPNLPPKPHTLLVPKVTVKNMEDANKIFGPAQAAVAKAVADAVEEGIIPKDKVDDWVIICSVFLHPEAKDYRKIYHYNYGATKLALKRAMAKYPPLEKVLYDKDRAKHPIMGYRVPRLWRPPYLQISLDIPDLERTKKIIAQIPKSDRIILEAGTPLIKRYGTKVISDLRETARDIFFMADLKTLDVGKVEVDIAYEETADGVIAAGLAPVETLDAFIYEAKRLGIYAAVDMLNVEDPIRKLKALKDFPDVVIIHRGIDQETGKTIGLELIQELKQTFKDRKFLIAVAGGIIPETAKEALEKGADIIVVGRYVTQSKDIERSVREFLELTPEMREDIDVYRVHVE